MKYVVTGANGQTGSAVVQRLLDRGHCVTVIVRRDEQAANWTMQGAVAVVADLSDPAAIEGVFDGAAGVYLMNPPAYGAPDIFAAASRVCAALTAEAERSGVAHVVALSSIGAQHPNATGNIFTNHDLERRLAASTMHISIVRAAYFMDNWIWSLARVMKTGKLPSMLLPTDRALPMVAATDIGTLAADLLAEGQSAPSLVELRGPQDYSPRDAAEAMASLLERDVRVIPLPEDQWPGLFRANGFSWSATHAFCEMYRGFNSGLVHFSGEGALISGSHRLEDVIARAVPR